MTNSIDRQPRSRRASVAPSAAAYLLRNLERAGLTPQAIRAEVVWRQRAGYPVEATELADAIDQLRWAARGVSLADLEPDTSARRNASDTRSETVPDSELLMITTAGAAELLGICQERVTQLIRSGRLRASRHGRSYLIARADALALRDLREGSQAA